MQHTFIALHITETLMQGNAVYIMSYTANIFSISQSTYRRRDLGLAVSTTKRRNIDKQNNLRRYNSENLVKFILRLFNNDNIHISTKNGIVYEGTLIGKEHGYLILKDVIIRNDKYITKVNYLLLKPDVIQHIYPKSIEAI